MTPEADAAPEAPALTLDPAPEAAAQQAAAEAERQKERDANAVKVDESMLSEAERKMVDDFAQKIDVTDSNVVLQYGSAAQKNIASFSENALNSVKTKDLGEVGEALSDLVVELKNFGKDEEKKGGLFGFFQKKRNELEAMKASYAKAEVNVDKIVRVLENHQVVLMKDIAMLDQMYELNTKYYKELTMYIIALARSVWSICGPTTWSSCGRRPPPAGPRRTPRPIMILPTCVAGLRRSSTTWS